MRLLQSLMGRYFLAHSEGPRDSQFCVVELCVCKNPASQYPEILRAMGKSFLTSSPALLDDLGPKLASWLRSSQRFVDERQHGQPGRCFDDLRDRVG